MSRRQLELRGRPSHDLAPLRKKQLPPAVPSASASARGGCFMGGSLAAAFHTPKYSA